MKKLKHNTFKSKLRIMYQKFQIEGEYHNTLENGVNTVLWKYK